MSKLPVDPSGRPSLSPRVVSDVGDPLPDRLQILRLAIAVEGGLAGLAFLIGWFSGQNILAGVQFELSSIGIGLASSLPMFLLLAVAIRSKARIFIPIRDVLNKVLLPWLSPCRLIDIALLASLAGISEELLFRACLQSLLGNWIGATSGLVAASVLFGVAHWITPGYALLATVAGFYLGTVWLATGGDILAVSIAHGFYDFVALLLLLKWHRQHNASPDPVD